MSEVSGAEPRSYPNSFCTWHEPIIVRTGYAREVARNETLEIALYAAKRDRSFITSAITEDY